MQVLADKNILIYKMDRVATYVNGCRFCHLDLSVPVKDKFKIKKTCNV